MTLSVVIMIGGLDIPNLDNRVQRFPMIGNSLEMD
jgi:hypothetical protein